MNQPVGSEIVIFAVVICFGLAVIVWMVSTHNRFVYLQNLIRESWANIDVALKRRHDLIPNLVETVKGYADHEKEVFERVVKARETAMTSLGNLSALAQSEQQLVTAVNTLIARVESYPELKANKNFGELQQELIDTEDRIAAARRFYNGNVREFNTYLERFPSSLFSGGRSPAEYFEVEEIRFREPVQVEL